MKNQSDDITRLKNLAEEYQAPLILEISPEMLDATLIKDLPVGWSRANAILPIRYKGKLAFLTENPGNLENQRKLELVFGENIFPVIAPKSLILSSIEHCYFNKEEKTADFLQSLDRESKVQAGTSTFLHKSSSSDLLESSEDAPVTQLVNLILLEAIKKNASDIHLEPYENKIRVRYRIDGFLYEQPSPPKHMEQALISRLKIMSHMDIAEKRLPQDGTARVHIGEREIDIRVSTIPIAEGERVVLRLLHRSSSLIPLSELGFSDEMLSDFKQIIKSPNGIIIVSGPTGSGKTTTLYAALQQLDRKHLNIITIEDPIEYMLEEISQIQVKPKIGLTFAEGLRHILRQDPDVVLVGEIRDYETAEIAIRASLTGHLVFTTLHTNDAPSAALRLIDIGIEPYLIASSLRAVLAQRLVRTLCGECKIKTQYLPEKDHPEIMQEALQNTLLYKPKGCGKCMEGFRGRTGLFELLKIDEELSEAIRSKHYDLASFRKLATSKGMKDILQDGIEKVKAGKTSVDELIRIVGTL